jgi:DNA-directed RNA polymerase subunit beta'
MGQLREVATRRDQLILDEREKEALKAVEQPVQLPAAE